MSADTTTPALALSALLPEPWVPLDQSVEYSELLRRLVAEFGEAKSIDVSVVSPLIGSFTEVERLLDVIDAHLAAVSFTENGAGGLAAHVLAVTALESEDATEVALVEQWRERGEVEPMESVDRPGVMNRFTIAADRPGAFVAGVRYLIKDICLLVVQVFSTDPVAVLDDEEAVLASVGVLRSD